MNDIYSASVTKDHSLSGYGSIEKGISGNYIFYIGEILSEAWEKVSGSKGAFFLALIIYSVLLLATNFIIEFIFTLLGLTVTEGTTSFNVIAVIVAILSQILSMAVTVPMTTALILMGLRCAVDSPIRGTMVLDCFAKIGPLVMTALLMYFMIFIGYLLLILPGIYLTVAYSQTLMLVVDKNLSGWRALETSRKAVTHNWWKLSGLYLAVSLIFILATLPFLLGLIWIIPWMLITGGIIYRNMFGYATQTQF